MEKSIYLYLHYSLYFLAEMLADIKKTLYIYSFLIFQYN